MWCASCLAHRWQPKGCHLQCLSLFTSAATCNTSGPKHLWWHHGWILSIFVSPSPLKRFNRPLKRTDATTDVDRWHALPALRRSCFATVALGMGQVLDVRFVTTLMTLTTVCKQKGNPSDSDVKSSKPSFLVEISTTFHHKISQVSYASAKVHCRPKCRCPWGICLGAIEQPTSASFLMLHRPSPS